MWSLVLLEAAWPGEQQLFAGKEAKVLSFCCQASERLLSIKNIEEKIMASTTLTRMDLSEAVFREVGLSRNESADLVESVLTHMSDSLVAGDHVKISSFGTFGLRDKTARVGRNPKTGVEAPIEPRRVLTFRPSSLMKERVAKASKD